MEACLRHGRLRNPLLGPGSGDWWLEFQSDLDIEVAAYVRTRDGFLTAMHDVVEPSSPTGAPYAVRVFNPGSNIDRRSLLRLINPYFTRDVRVDIFAVDDAGNSGGIRSGVPDPGGRVSLTLPAGSAVTLDSRQLEEGDRMLGATNLGDGEGKWRMAIEAEGDIHVVNLLESPGGNLTIGSMGVPEQATGLASGACRSTAGSACAW